MSTILNKPLVPGASAVSAGSGVTSVPASKAPAASSVPAKLVVVSEDNYKYLQQEIYRQSGIVLDEDKHYLLESRLMPVARAASICRPR